MTTDDDRDLRDLLAAVDPARSSPAPDPATVEAHMAHVMTRSDLDTGPVTPPRRGRWVAAAAAVAAVAAAGAVGIASLGGPVAAPGPTEPVVAATYTASPPDLTASCLPVSAELLAGAPTAFAGTVVTVEGDLAVLDVTRWYRGGGGAERVAVRAPDAELTALLGTPQLEPGKSYLVTVGVDGQVGGCGTSGLDEPVLRGLYEQAFA